MYNGFLNSTKISIYLMNAVFRKSYPVCINWYKDSGQGQKVQRNIEILRYFSLVITGIFAAKSWTNSFLGLLLSQEFYRKGHN